MKSYSSKIKEIEQKNLNDLSVLEEGIKESRKYLQKLRVIVRDNIFEKKEEEIDFFLNFSGYLFVFCLIIHTSEFLQ